jgi:hypothetical protein
MALAEIAVIRAATAKPKPVSSSTRPIVNHTSLGGHLTHLTAAPPLQDKLLGNKIKPKPALGAESLKTNFSWKTFAILAVVVIAIFAVANR